MISLIQTAEGALNETHDILQRMRELAVQSSNDTNKNEDRAAIQDEVNQLAKEITRIADTTQFNGQSLMKNGDAFSGKLLIGANSTQTLDVSFNAMDAASLSVNGGNPTSASATEVAFVAGDMDEFSIGSVTATNYKQSSNLEINLKVTDATNGTADIKITKDGKEYTASGVVTNTGDGTSASGAKFVLSSTVSGLEDVFKAGESIEIAIDNDLTDDDEVNIKVKGQIQGSDGINVSSQTAAESALDTIDQAITTVSNERSKMGAWSNRLDHTIKNLSTSSENLTAAESRIRDVDYALAA